MQAPTQPNRIAEILNGLWNDKRQLYLFPDGTEITDRAEASRKILDDYAHMQKIQRLTQPGGR